jgi:hypothetical protein
MSSMARGDNGGLATLKPAMKKRKTNHSTQSTTSKRQEEAATAAAERRKGWREFNKRDDARLARYSRQTGDAISTLPLQCQVNIRVQLCSKFGCRPNKSMFV